VRSTGSRLVAVTVATFAIVAVSPAGARAACLHSTPASASFTDDPFDGELGLAPELTYVDMSLGAACEVVVTPKLGDRSETAGLIRDEAVATYIDSDGNPSTGAPVWDGADRVVVVVGQNGADLPPVLGTWTEGGFSFADAVTLPVVGAAGFTATLDQLGAPGPTTLGIRVASSWSGLYGTYDDRAPAPGAPSYAFPIIFAAGVPGPAAVATPSTPAPVASAKGRRASCTVPNVRRLTAAAARRKLRRAGCRSRVVRIRGLSRSGRVVSTSPRAGAQTRRTVLVRIRPMPVRGARPA
jgi:PASTA domain